MTGQSDLHPPPCLARRNLGEGGCPLFSTPLAVSSDRCAAGGGLWYFQLRQHSCFDFLHTYSPCCTFIVSSLVEEFFQERRNDLFQKPIVVNFPRARAGEKSYASRTRPQRQMHRQTITTDQALVVANIRKVLE